MLALFVIKKCPLRIHANNYHKSSPKEKNSGGQKMYMRIHPQKMPTRIHPFWYKVSTRSRCPQELHPRTKVMLIRKLTVNRVTVSWVRSTGDRSMYTVQLYVKQRAQNTSWEYSMSSEGSRAIAALKSHINIHVYYSNPRLRAWQRKMTNLCSRPPNGYNFLWKYMSPFTPVLHVYLFRFQYLPILSI